MILTGLCLYILYHEKPFERTEHTADPESMPQMKTLFNCQLLTNKQPLPVCKHKIIQMPVTQMFVLRKKIMINSHKHL